MLRVICCVLTAVAAYAATPLYEASLNQGYTVERGQAAPDSAVTRTGKASLRIEPAKTGDAAVRLAPIHLSIGKRYELSGWVRTEDLAVQDSGRSPIATAAALTMASMPYDVHSTAIGGTRDWTRVNLRFIASHAEDQIVLTAGTGGSFRGKAWFEGVSLDEVGSKDAWPAREAVQTFGPAYRYPAAGWIYLHIEGEPYERGYQHGRLMSKEIPEYMDRCAADLGSAAEWSNYRTTVNALFLRGFDREILEEMRGIADGASDAGARWQGRRIDLLDVVVANTTVELDELRSAMTVTPTGLENLNFTKPAYAGRDSVLEHCSAFAATGPATRDGKMVIGHVTWWPLTLAEQTNVMLDIKPAKGHRMLIQSYPGGIESGTDWYQNDAGMVLTETTIRQTPFNAEGTPVAFRARAAIQYSSSIDEMVKLLGTRNNGLYTNEWIMGDAKTDEVAMYELGTKHTKLWRSSKNEWFNNTTGFYWGNNNAKDLAIRLETMPDPHGAPEYMPFVPAVRDLAWQEFYNNYKGKIDEQFGFTAYRTAPLVAATTMDAKVITSDMAKQMMVWAEFGRPNQREWLPGGRSTYAKNDGLYPSGYHLLTTEPSESLRASIAANEKQRLAAKAAERPAQARAAASLRDRLWNGWVLPASDSDVWFAAGSASYHHVLSTDNVDRAMAAARVSYRGLQLGPQNEAAKVRLEELKGVLFLDALRRKSGDEAFLKLMTSYFEANTTKTVSAQSFLEKAGVKYTAPEAGDGAAYLTSDISRRLSSAIVVYGTNRDAGANRYAAESLQARYLEQLESKVPIYKDFELTADLLRAHDVVFVGRPESNSALAEWAGKLSVSYDGASFKIDGETHASEREGLLFAAKNPLDSSHMVLVIAGNDALRTVKSARVTDAAEYVVYSEGSAPGLGFIGQGVMSSERKVQGRR